MPRVKSAKIASKLENEIKENVNKANEVEIRDKAILPVPSKGSKKALVTRKPKGAADKKSQKAPVEEAPVEVPTKKIKKRKVSPSQSPSLPKTNEEPTEDIAEDIATVPTVRRGRRLATPLQPLEEKEAVPKLKVPIKKRATKRAAQDLENVATLEPIVDEIAKQNKDVEKKEPAAKRGAKKAKAEQATASKNDEKSAEIPVVAVKEKGSALRLIKTPISECISFVKKVLPKKRATKKDENSAASEPVQDILPVKPVIQKKVIGKKEPAAKRGGNKPSTSKDVEEPIEDTKAKKEKKILQNATETSYTKADFELAGKESFNLKISSWNVAGLRSWVKKDGLKFLQYEKPDIFCMQEIKCTTDQLPDEAARISGYHPYWLCMPGGHAGVAIYSKIMPIHVEYGIGDAEFDQTGRAITAEYEKFFLINVYVPNSGRKLVNLEARMRWEKVFLAYIKKLDKRKPVLICGDMNVSHEEIDLANPKTNGRSAGFTREERDKMSELLSAGFVDTFRHLYPEKIGAYTYWTYLANARSRNVGWRLDYFIVSQRITKRIVDNCIRTQCKGSDHCPITLFLKM